MAGRFRTVCTRLLPLLLLTLPAAVQAQFNYYVTINGTITITGYTGPDGDVVIPERIDGLPVNTLTDGWSYYSDPEWTNSSARFYRLRSP